MGTGRGRAGGRQGNQVIGGDSLVEANKTRTLPLTNFRDDVRPAQRESVEKFADWVRAQAQQSAS